MPITREDARHRSFFFLFSFFSPSLDSLRADEAKRRILYFRF